MSVFHLAGVSSAIFPISSPQCINSECWQPGGDQSMPVSLTAALCAGGSVFLSARIAFSTPVVAVGCTVYVLN